MELHRDDDIVEVVLVEVQAFALDAHAVLLHAVLNAVSGFSLKRFLSRSDSCGFPLRERHPKRTRQEYLLNQRRGLHGRITPLDGLGASLTSRSMFGELVLRVVAVATACHYHAG